MIGWKTIQQLAAFFGKARQRANQSRLTAYKSANTKKLLTSPSRDRFAQRARAILVSHRRAAPARRHSAKSAAPRIRCPAYRGRPARGSGCPSPRSEPRRGECTSPAQAALGRSVRSCRSPCARSGQRNGSAIVSLACWSPRSPSPRRPGANRVATGSRGFSSHPLHLRETAARSSQRSEDGRTG